MNLLAKLLVRYVLPALVLFAQAGQLWARLPAEYGAVMVSAPAAQDVRQFDLRPALEQARASGKPILIYFGAFDCPYCKQLESSFAQHKQVLSARIKKKYFVIEIEGWLRGAKMEFITALTVPTRWLRCGEKWATSSRDSSGRPGIRWTPRCRSPAACRPVQVPISNRHSSRISSSFELSASAERSESLALSASFEPLIRSAPGMPRQIFSQSPACSNA